jgi:hypothetical protein
MNFIALVIDYPTGRRVVCISEKDRKVASLLAKIAVLFQKL